MHYSKRSTNVELSPNIVLVSSKVQNLAYFTAIDLGYHASAGGLMYPFGYAGPWRSSLTSVLLG